MSLFNTHIEARQTERNKVSNIDIDPYEFMFECLYTIDQGDSKIKQFPDKEYLRHLVGESVDAPLLLVVKSRQMAISWFYCGMALWWILTHPGSSIFMVSEKEEKAGYANQNSLLSRIEFMYDRLPARLKKYKPVAKRKPPSFGFNEINSYIYGMSQDSEALRGYTASIVIWDEFAFMDHAEQAYAAVKPATMSGGKIWGVSTLNGRHNTFYRLAYDEHQDRGQIKSNLVDSQETIEDVIESRETTPIMKGMYKRSNRNDYKVVFLHYSADPHRDKKWAAEQRKSWDNQEQWEQEMELSPISTAGLRVVTEFNPENNIRKFHRFGADGRKIFTYNPDKPLWRGWDFGYHHPACVWGQPQHNGEFHVYAEYLGEDITIQPFAQQVIELTDKYFPGVKLYDAGDPAVTQVNDKSEKTSAEILRSLGIRIQTRRVRPKDRVNLLRTMCREKRGGFIGLKADSGCQVINDAFLGGYLRNDKDEPIKDGYYDHLMDALQYLLINLYDIRTGDRLKNYTPFYRPRPSADDITGY